MNEQRRRFLLTAAGLAAAAPFSAAMLASRSAFALDDAPPRKLRVLMLGGTGFLGPHTVEYAMKRGHTVTLFNRGRTRPHLFEELEQLRGDRDGDLDALKGREWDVVVDTSGYVPRIVRDSATLLKDAVGQYIFISSVSAYASFPERGMDETAPVGTLIDETIEEVNGHTFGPLKALCEQAAEEVMPGRVTNIRPGLIVGPGDNTDRFTYWPVRVSRGGEVLAPNSPEDETQLIDVHDLAEWIIHCAERRVTGLYNATGPNEALTMGAMLEACRRASGSDARFTWVSKEFLSGFRVGPWSDMPCWIPAEGDYTGFASVSNARAVRQGLTFRPILDTCRATLEWWNEQPEERRARLRAGINPDREREVLAAYAEAKGES
ncbi:MAG: SDR family oxidoreductase [Phycisphaeraceae bacterium]|nr:MAG: SDR family oxidoreductase [Phycisphaeraceae bacterium]